MPNIVDAVNTLLGAVRSGLVVSGNSYITVCSAITTGDALTSMQVSGKTDLIAFSHSRTETKPLTGGTFTEIAEYIDAHIFIHYPTATSSSAAATLQQRVDDFKTTIAAASFTNPALPIFVSETCPMHHKNQSKTALTYRFRYVM